jgi:hypothetical protein
MVQSFGVSIFLHLIVSCQKKEYGCTRTLSFQILEACSCCAVVVVLCVLALFFVFPCNKFDGELYWLMSNIHLFACAGEETLPKDVSRLLNCLKLLVQCIHDPGIQKRETGEKSLILLWWTVSVR